MLRILQHNFNDMAQFIPDSELILNADGSVFHLHIHPDDVADNVILVGDPDRADLVASFFSKINVDVQNREFRTRTGLFNGKGVTVVSTGIGTDNIDIVVNELDAAIRPFGIMVKEKCIVPMDENDIKLAKYCCRVIDR